MLVKILRMKPTVRKNIAHLVSHKKFDLPSLWGLQRGFGMEIFVKVHENGMTSRTAGIFLTISKHLSKRIKQ